MRNFPWKILWNKRRCKNQTCERKSAKSAAKTSEDLNQIATGCSMLLTSAVLVRVVEGGAVPVVEVSLQCSWKLQLKF